MKLKKWETALILSLAAALIFGASLMREQQMLADKLIRLHVVANSDSDVDQSLKLNVRDRILSELGDVLDGITDRDEAVRLLETRLPEITAAAEDEIRARGYDYSVKASLGVETFPTREYDTFSLPAGRYESLRVEIGGAEGKNWWCVVFPPLCASDSAAGALDALSQDEISLITEDTPGYVVKFKSIEWLEKLRGVFGF